MDTPLVILQYERIECGLQKKELIDRILPLRTAWVAGGKNQVSFLHAQFRYLQIVGQMRGLAIFIHAKKSDIKVVARKLEVVRVASKECDVAFRREYQAHIRIFLVLV